jgi:hypothetical protein
MECIGGSRLFGSLVGFSWWQARRLHSRGVARIHSSALWVGWRAGGYSWRSCNARLLGHLVAAAPRVFHSGRSATRRGARSESSALVCHRHGRSYTHCDCGGVSSEFFSPLRPNYSPQPTADRRGNSRMTTSILKFGALLAPVSGG